MSHFVELDFELVDLLQNRPEAGDFGVSNGHGVAGAVVLSLCADLSLLCQLDHSQRESEGKRPKTSATYRLDSALDRLHQPVKVIAERLQAARIQQ